MIDWTNFNLTDKTLNFVFRPKKIQPHLTGLDAALYNIEYIKKNYPAPYTLYLSGGSDSQAMLYAWVKSDTPFKTFSGIYNFESNWYDLETGKLFAESLNVKIDYHNFDLIDFLETEHNDFALKYKTGSPQFTAFIKMASLTTEGTVIFSGECKPPKNFVNPNSPPIVIPSLNDMGLYYYGLIEHKPIVPWFFLETETIAYSWNYNSKYTFIPSYSSKDSNIIANNNDERKGYIEKIAIYHENGYPVIPQDNKQNGFEKIKNFYDFNSPRNPSIQDKLAFGFERSRRNFDLLYRNKYEDKLKNYKYNLLW